MTHVKKYELPIKLAAPRGVVAIITVAIHANVNATNHIPSISASTLDFTAILPSDLVSRKSSTATKKTAGQNVHTLTVINHCH